MKKFLIFAMAMFMAVGLTSCSNGEGRADDPVQDMTAKQDSYSYEGFVADDVLSLYDVTITCTTPSGTQTYTLTTEATLKDGWGNPYSGRTTTKHSFTVDKGANVLFNATVSLKSNYEEVLASKTDWNLYYRANIGTPGHYSGSAIACGGSYSTATLQAKPELLSKMATSIISELSGK